MISQLFDEGETARLLRVKTCTVRNERKRGKLGFTQIGARIFYSEEQIKDYLESQKVSACTSANRSPVKSEISGLAKSPAAKAPTMRGAGHGTMASPDRHVISALARQTFTRPARL